MDARAVLAASSDDLTQLGLNQRGHVLCLKAEAMKSTELTDVKRKGILATSIKKSTSERVVSKNASQNSEIKIVQVGWKHSTDRKHFCQVRKQSGGGVRELHLSVNDSLSKIKEEAVKLFFPNGISKKYGTATCANINLGDFVENL